VAKPQRSAQQSVKIKIVIVMETDNSVVDIKKLTDEQIGKLYRKANEIIRRSNEGTISFNDSIELIQKIIIEGKVPLFLDVVRGLAEIKYLEHLIDSDSAPFIPNGMSVEEHKKGGLFKFDPAKIFPYLSKKQKKGSIGGHDLRKELANLPVLNANVLDYLLAHPELIPEEWKNKYIFFWGTIYSDSVGYLYVRCLDWNGSKWDWDCSWLDSDFNSDNPAALAS
jgi:hypothetical protein